MKGEVFRAFMSFLLIVAILYAPEAIARPDPPPPAVAACIVAVIGVACVGIMVYGLYKMCQHIPAPDGEPPAWAPVTEIPGMGPPSYMHPLPPIKLHDQLFTSKIALQHQDRDSRGWQTDYTFMTTDSQIGGVAMVAYDANGAPLVTNDVPLISYEGENCAPLMFTNLPPAMADNVPGRIFRMVVQ